MRRHDEQPGLAASLQREIAGYNDIELAERLRALTLERQAILARKAVLVAELQRRGIPVPTTAWPGFPA